MLGLPASSALLTSAKTGAGVAALLPAIIDRVPPPPGDAGAPTRALLFDAHHDAHRGAVCLVVVADGRLERGDKVVSAASGDSHEVQELGILAPEPTPTAALLCGQVSRLRRCCRRLGSRRRCAGRAAAAAAAGAATATATACRLGPCKALQTTCGVGEP
eukprot:356096-Chlamydomonas_euryale.AAC.1